MNIVATRPRYADSTERRWRDAVFPFGVLLLALLLAGCGTTGYRKGTEQSVIIEQAGGDLPEAALLDVWIELFEPGPIPNDAKGSYGITLETRKAEARFIPGHLKKTMQQTGYWGAVRVVPQESPGAELLVSGRILQSDGEVLSLRLQARDSTGLQWLDKEYRGFAEPDDYGRISRDHYDAFQNLYNAIANDLARIKQKLPSKSLITIRQLAELRFAADLAPDSFTGYVREEDGRYQLRRLPAREDPMLQRIRAIRERDYLLIDTVNDHYDAYYRDIWDPYANWRRFRAEEAASLRKVEREALTRKVLGIGAVVGAIALSMAGGRDTAIRTDSLRQVMVLGGIMVAKSGFDKDSEKQIHIDALEELGTSFESEAAPMVVEVEGETHRLTGSVDAQYAKWRALLRKIHASETGLARDYD